LGFALGCGGGGMATGGGTNPAPESLVISKTRNGAFRVAMSTSFQPAEWDDQFFTLNPGAPTPVGETGSAPCSTARSFAGGTADHGGGAWDFGVLDAITQPVLGVADQSPEFQIAVAPGFRYDTNHDFIDPRYAQFAVYAQDLVRYYNIPGGFSAADGQHASPSGAAITWWGIYNEPNFNNLDSTQYTQLYNTVVPAMQAVDPSLKYAAVELGDYSGLANQFLPAFASGVTAHVDILATHFYSTCDQKDDDATIFTTVPGFYSEVGDIHTQLGKNPALSAVASG
jgi:hypothetical protein